MLRTGLLMIALLPSPLFLAAEVYRELVGEVTDAQIQFGDAVLVTKVQANVQTLREKRAVSQGKNPRLEMQLPTYSG